VERRRTISNSQNLLAGDREQCHLSTANRMMAECRIRQSRPPSLPSDPKNPLGFILGSGSRSRLRPFRRSITVLCGLQSLGVLETLLFHNNWVSSRTQQQLARYRRSRPSVKLGSKILTLLRGCGVAFFIAGLVISCA
jgi:hypothetical protein